MNKFEANDNPKLLSYFQLMNVNTCTITNTLIFFEKDTLKYIK